MTVLDVFRQMQIEATNEDGNLEIAEPQIFVPTGPSGIPRADVIGNNAYFNNLSVIGSPQSGASSLTANWITPTANPVGEQRLGVYPPPPDGTNARVAYFDLYESVLNPGATPQFGVMQFTRLSICSSPPSGPFIITTSFSTTGGFPRGILLAPSDILQLGSNTTARWDIQTSSGNLVPSAGQTCDIGMPGNPNGPVANVYAYTYNVVSWGWQAAGGFVWDQTSGRALLRMAPSGLPNTGNIQMRNADSIGWRNGTNTGDVLLSVDSTNRLVLNGVAVAGNPGTTFSGAITVVVNGVARQVPYV